MNWLRKLLDKLRAPGEAIAVPVGYISAKVYRAETGKWEDLGVIATAHKGAV